MVPHTGGAGSGVIVLQTLNIPIRWAALIVVLAVSVSLAQTAPPPETMKEPLPADWCKDLPRPGYASLERVPASDNWFEIYRVRPGVFAIYEPHHYEEEISFLILGEKRALLFDTGLGVGDMRKAVSGLTKLPVTVLNSHTHFDHVGDNWQFRDILGVDSSFTRLHEKGASHEQVEDTVVPGRFCSPAPPGFVPRDYVIKPFHIAHFVEDGQVIDLGGRKLEVLLTPGHAPDSLCLLDRKNKLLFTGDTFYAGPLFLFTPETSVDDYERSITRLAKLAPQLELLLPSHNFPVERPEMLERVVDAMAAIRSGKAKFEVGDGRREYNFEGFSVLMKQ